MLAGAVERIIPPATLHAVVTEMGATEQRRRKIPAQLALLTVVALHWYPRTPVHRAFRQLLKGLRLVALNPDAPWVTKGALCKARYRLGARPLVAVFHAVCQPLATPATPGAFLGRWRLMAIDGTTEDVADTPANERAFGRHHTDRGPSAFPQLQAVYLIECGSHAIVDAGIWPCHTSEHVGARRMLRSVQRGMLVLWDSGLHSWELARRTRARGAHFLGRVPGGVNLRPVRRLADSSYLAYLGSDHHGRPRRDALLVRVLEYTLDDPALPGYGERHRLMTSLLNPRAYPARELICGYHERWEAELTIDEVDTHQRLSQQPLRSQKPVGVIQEMYGLLLAHYVIRALMHEAAVAADLDPDRLSFSHAVQVLGDAIAEFQMVQPAQRPALYRRLLADLARDRLPERARRRNPRVVKRKMSKYRVKRAEHRNWPQPCKPFREAVVLIDRAA